MLNNFIILKNNIKNRKILKTAIKKSNEKTIPKNQFIQYQKIDKNSNLCRHKQLFNIITIFIIKQNISILYLNYTYYYTKFILN